ncbi:MAG: hypothetical protein NTZ80_01910 [Patescibacteria group bacterium]|nr:hypothetical protein [Patescibacteria group bacterium]
MKFTRTFKITVTIVTVFAVTLLMLGIQGDWLSTNIMNEKKQPDLLLQDLSDLRNAFQLRMDKFLASYRPGKFDQNKCLPARLVAENKDIPSMLQDLLDSGQMAWGFDEKTTLAVNAFNSLSTREEKLTFMREYLDKSGSHKDELISFNLYEAFLQGYFIEYGDVLSAENKLLPTNSGDASQTAVSLLEVMDLSSKVAAQAESERIAGEVALDSALIFLEEEHRAATMISGLCNFLENSDNFRKTSIKMRKQMQAIFPKTGDYSIK